MSTIEKIFYIVKETIIIALGCYVFVEGIKSICLKIIVWLDLRNNKKKQEEIRLEEFRKNIQEIARIQKERGIE